MTCPGFLLLCYYPKKRLYLIILNPDLTIVEQLMNSACDMNKLLLELYTTKWDGLISLINEPQNRDLSDPLLLSVDNHYVQAKTKLMVIGQETHKWELPGSSWPLPYVPTEYPAKLMDHYAKMHWSKSFPAYPFWRAADYIYEQLNDCQGQRDIGYLWNDFDKVDDNGKPLSEQMRKQVQQCFSLLREEISITFPDVVLFFTGERYDGYLEQLGAKLESTTSESGISFELLAKVVLPGIFPERTYMLNHPGRLLRIKQWGILDIIVKLCK
ncbi:MAG: hypothetical protein ACYC7E_11645 [Armatimonadota bacterium]